MTQQQSTTATTAPQDVSQRQQSPPTTADTHPQPSAKSEITGRQAYNIVSDTVGGVNLRVKDNVIQAIGIAIGVVIGAGIGVLVVKDWRGGLLIGGLLGLFAGLVLTGVGLMIYRGVRHMRGKHD